MPLPPAFFRMQPGLPYSLCCAGHQEPILALRRQLAALSGAAEQAGECWLQLAQLCRGTGHYEAATTAVLEAIASREPRAPLEHVQVGRGRGCTCCVLQAACKRPVQGDDLSSSALASNLGSPVTPIATYASAYQDDAPTPAGACTALPPCLPAQLLWDKGQPYRAISEATVLLSQAQEHRLAAPFAQEAEHSRFHAQARPASASAVQHSALRMQVVCKAQHVGNCRRALMCRGMCPDLMLLYAAPAGGSAACAVDG